MRAIRYLPDPPHAGRVALDPRAPMPSPDEGLALVRPTRLAIGSSDLAIASGRIRPKGPLTLGCEFVGVVERAMPRKGHERLAKGLEGKRVVGSTDIVCTRCDMCRRGLKHHCRERRVLGVDVDGCLADAFVIPLENLRAVPDKVDDDRAVFAHVLSAAVHASQQVHLEGKPYVTVLGDGPLGMLCAQVMNRMNASVRLIGKHEGKLALCDRWGVKHRPLRDIGLREDQDVVVDCTGTPEGLETAMRLVRPKGSIVLKGLHTAWSERAVDLSPVAAKELEIVGSRATSLGEALSALERGEVDVLPMITRRCRLEEGETAMTLAREAGCVRVLVEP